MKLRHMLPFRLLVAAFFFFTSVQAQSDGLSQLYCSPFNTASGYNAVNYQYQSNGACKTQCQQNYAFGIVQDRNCWCSNYAPGPQVPVSYCNKTCPGYPSDLCGNIDNGYYGYIYLNRNPSGTSGGISSPSSTSTLVSTETPWTLAGTLAHLLLQARQINDESSSTATNTFTRTFFTRTTSSSSFTTSSTSSPNANTFFTQITSSTSSSILTDSSQTSPSSISSTTSQLLTSTVSTTPTGTQTVTQSQDATTVVSYVTLAQSSSTSTSSSTLTSTSTSSSSSSSTDAPSPVVSTQVIQVSGAVVTQTVTTTPSSSSQADKSALEAQQKQGLSGGDIAGIVIGVIAGIALLLLGLFFLWRRKKRSEQEKVDSTFAAAGVGANEKGKRSPRRNVSVLSKSGLIGGVGLHDNSGEKDYDEPINTGTSSQRHSMLFGAGANGEGVSPVSPLEQTNSNDSRRHSKPLVYDQRLNPSALFASHDNGSRVSMQDGADYSRTLGVTNPDPRVSFESRISRQG